MEEHTEIDRPQIVKGYNTVMGGVDKSIIRFNNNSLQECTLQIKLHINFCFKYTEDYKLLERTEKKNTGLISLWDGTRGGVLRVKQFQ